MVSLLSDPLAGVSAEQLRTRAAATHNLRRDPCGPAPQAAPPKAL
jgi:hypothetical protein